MLKGNSFLCKVTLEESGKVFRAQLTENGNELSKGSFAFQENSGLALTIGNWGELVMPLIKKSKILVCKPVSKEGTTLEILSVHSPYGNAEGGNKIMITGSYLDHVGVQVFVGRSEMHGSQLCKLQFIELHFTMWIRKRYSYR